MVEMDMIFKRGGRRIRHKQHGNNYQILRFKFKKKTKKNMLMEEIKLKLLNYSLFSHVLNVAMGNN